MPHFCQSYQAMLGGYVGCPPPLAPVKPAMEAVFTMTPPPCFSNTGITARIPRIGAVRFVEITLSQISSLTSPAGRSSSKTPALFTRISIRPNRPKAEFIIRCTSSSLVTSTSTGITSDWFCCNVSAIFLTSIPLMSARITFAPSLANKTAIAFPLPGCSSRYNCNFIFQPS